jgi:hypothetical protein
VSASIRQQDGESVGEEKLGVSDHAEAVVAETVEQEDGVAVGVVGMDEPGTESGVVGSGDGDVGEVGVEGEVGVADRRDFI